MSTHSRCPDESQLRDYLNGQVSIHELSRFGCHFDSCPTCQEALHRIESSESRSLLLAGSLDGPTQQIDPADDFEAPDPAFLDRLKALKTDGNGTEETIASDFDRGLPSIVGSTIQNYRIQKEIGRGGMGVVYQAWQQGAERMVALKVVRTKVGATDAELQRFSAEIRAVARLKHPMIVPVYEVGEHDGSPFFSMEYVDGESLAVRLRKSPLEADEAAQICLTIADAIAYAHDQGVLHRDIKPGNILIDSNGLARVADFGLAKHLDDDLELTATGQILGTPNYMPPEQAQGKSSEIGFASDVYSIGAVLYCCLTGRPPFQAATVIEVLNQVIHDPPVTPATLNRRIDRDLETICLQCLDKNPRNRYDGADELAGDLRRWSNGEPIKARRISTATRLLKWARRRPAIAAQLLTSLIACIAISFNVGRAQHAERLQRSLEMTQKANSLVEQERQRTAVSLANEQRANDQARLAEYYQRIALAQNAWKERRVLEMARLLTACAKQHRNWEHAFLRESQKRGVVQSSFKDPPKGLAISRNTDQIIVARHYGPEVVIWKDSKTLSTIATLEEKKPQLIRFTHDGGHVAVQRWDGILNLYRGPNQLVSTWELKSQYCRDLAVAPDLSFVVRAVGGREDPGAELSLLAENNLKEDERISPPFSVFQMHALNDSQTVLLAGTDLRSGADKVAFLDVPTKALKIVDSWRGRGVASLAWDSVNRQIYVGYNDRTIRHLDDQGRQLNAVELVDVPMCLSVSPAADRIAVGLQGGTAQIWNSGLSTRTRELVGHLRSITHIEFLPDSEDVITTSDDLTVRRWRLQAPGMPMLIRGRNPRDSPAQPDVRLAWSPDSRWLAVSDGGLKVESLRLYGSDVTPIKSSAEDDGPAVYIQFIRDRTLLSVSKSGKITTFSLDDTDHWRKHTVGHLSPPLESIDVDPEQNRLVYASGNYVKMVDLTNGREIASVQSKGLRTAGVDIVDGRDLVAIISEGNSNGGDGFSIEKWNLQNNQCDFIFDRRFAYPTLIREINGGQAVVMSDRIGQLICIDLNSKKVRWANSSHLARAGAMAISPDQRRIASCSNRGSVWIRDAATGQVLMSLEPRKNAIADAAFSPDNRSLAVVDQFGEVAIWSVNQSLDSVTR